MKRVISLSLIAILFALAAATTPDPQTKEPRPRYTPPKDGRPGWIDIVQYFAMANPKEAASLLLREAPLAGLDVDQTMPLPAHDGLGFRGSSVIIRPDPADNSFVQAVETNLAQGAAGDTICVIVWTRRFPSIRETAEMMTLGVKIANDGSMGKYIARVPLASVPAIAAIAPVVWIGAYLPEYKYDPDWPFPGNGTAHIHWFSGDSEAHRRELNARGAQVLGTTHEGWVVHVMQDSIPRIAQLPWVKLILQNEPKEIY